LCGVIEALKLIEDYPQGNFTIFIDSKSVLDAIQAYNSTHPFIGEVLTILLRLVREHKYVKLCWVPGHVGVSGNERADHEAKQVAGTNVEPLNLMVPCRDYYPVIKTAVRRLWQQEWNNTVNNKLKSIKPTVSEWTSSGCRTRRKEVLLSRLRIGHTRLTHGHLMERLPQPRCVRCSVPLTVKHILAECPNNAAARYTCFPGLRGCNVDEILVGMLAETERAVFDVDALLLFLEKCKLLQEI
jgi:hypothetical protein